jgi:hypothetical protein
VRKLSPFFFDGAAAKKNQKTAFGEFRLCGGDLGLCPKTLRAFEKARPKLFVKEGLPILMKFPAFR